MPVEKITIDLEAETTGFQKDLKKAEDFARDTGKALDPILKQELELDFWKARVELIKAQAEIKKTRKQFDKGAISEDALAKAELWFKNIASAATEAGARLQNFKNKWDPTISRFNIGFKNLAEEIKKTRSELEKAWKSTKGIDNFQRKLDSLWKDLKDWRIDINKYQDEIKNLQKDLENSGGGFDWLIWKVKDFGVALGWVIAAGAALTGVVLVVDEQEKAFIKLENQVWNTNRELEDLEQILLNLDSTWFLQNIGDWVKLISTLSKETKESNKALNETAIGVAWIANVFDKDLNEVVRANTALQKTYWLSWKESNDIITSSLQRTWDTYDDLLDSINEYAAKASDANIPVWKFINTLIDWTNAGIRNTDELADVQREFAIRLLDGSKTSKKALQELWFDFDDLIQKIDSGAIDVWDAMWLVATALLWVDSKVKQNQLSTDLLWTKYEDNWKIILDTIANADSELQWYIWTTDKLVDKSQTGLTAIKWGFNELKWTLVNEVWPAFNSVWETIWFVLRLFGKLVEVVKVSVQSLKVFKTFIAVQFVRLSDIVSWFVSNFSKNIEILTENIITAFNNIPGSIQVAINKALKPIQWLFNTAIDWINKIKKFTGWELIKPVEIWVSFVSEQNLPKFKDFIVWDLSTTAKASKILDDEIWKLSESFENLTTLEKKLSDDTVKLNKKTDDNTKSTDDNTESIDNNTKTKIKNSEEKKKADDLEEKRNKNLWKSLKSLEEQYEEIWDVFDDNTKKSENSLKKLQREIDNTTDKIEDIKEKSEDSANDFSKNFGWSASRLREQFESLEKTFWPVLETLTGTEIIWISWVWEEITINKLRDFIETKKEQLKIEEELKEAESNLEKFQESKTEEEEILKKFQDVKIKLEEQSAQKIWRILEQITDKAILENKKQEDSLEALRKKAIAAAAALRSVNSWSSSSSISWSTSNINNSRSTNIWTINVTDDTQAKSLERTLNTQIR